MKHLLWPLVALCIASLIAYEMHLENERKADADLTIILIDSIITTRIDSLQSLILNSEDLDRLEAMKDSTEHE